MIFAGSFYRHCWDIVGQDVLAVQFFRTDRVFPGLNFNFIVLIPKPLTTLTVDQFWLTALDNIMFKVIIKIIVDRLAVICSRIILPNQFDFIQSRQIGNHIIRVSEWFNILIVDSRGGQLALKFDI